VLGAGTRGGVEMGGEGGTGHVAPLPLLSAVNPMSLLSGSTATRCVCVCVVCVRVYVLCVCVFCVSVCA
jgi:hypothetical protein